MQRGSVGGVEPNGAATHVRESHDSSSTKPNEYKSHTHSLDVSLSFRFRICRARDQASQIVFDETPKDVVCDVQNILAGKRCDEPGEKKASSRDGF